MGDETHVPIRSDADIVVARQQGSKQGIVIISRDEGSGIPDIAQAMQDGDSTGNSLGLGLPGTKRLMDEFDIVSLVGRGTTVTIKKWVS